MSVETREGTGEETEEGEKEEGVSPAFVATVGVCSLVVGGLVGYALINIGTVAVGVGGVLAAVGAGYYLYRKDRPAEAAGSASYLSAIVILLTPFALYLPDIVLRGEEVRLFAQDVQATDVSIGGGALFEAGGLSIGGITQGNVNGIIALVVWLVVALVVALVLFVIGKFLKAVAKDGRGKSAN